VSKARNDLNSPVPKFCLVLETSRRTNEGRVRTAQELVGHFFPHTEGSSTDRLFHFFPHEVRGPMLTSWGVRGQKSALRDSDEKVRAVVHDALVAGDVDAAMFEASIAPDVMTRWIDLPDWWTFWRGGKLAKYSILKALETGYDLGLFDAEWFLHTVASKDGRSRGTDLLAEGLSKADLTEWLRAIYTTADGSPRGIVAALGWDQIVSKTADDVLVAVLDAIAGKVGLKEDAKSKHADAAPVAAAAPVASPAAAPVVAAPPPPAAAAPTTPRGEEARAPMETWTPAAPPVAADDSVEARGPGASLKSPGVPIASPAHLSEVPAEAKPAETKPARAEVRSVSRRLPAIFIPSTARVSDLPAEPKAPPPAAEPPGEEVLAGLFKDEEIPISADSFDDLGGSPRPPSVRPAPEEPPAKGKRPSKAPSGAKA
jgi:hypothetical protein